MTPDQSFVDFELAVSLACLMFGAMTFPTALQEMTPAPMRTRLVSIIIVVNTCSALSAQRWSAPFPTG